MTLLRRPPLNWCVAVATAGVLACRPAARPAGDSSAPAGADTMSAPVPAARLADSSVTARGIGALRVGMSLREARTVVPGLELPPGSDGQGCEYGRSPALPARVLVMVENGVVVRIDVDSSNVATAEGVRVGDTVAKLRTVYGSRLTSAPNKYSSEPDFRVRSSIPDDTLHEIVLETAAGKVRGFHAGQRPQVRYVEGCS